MNSKVHVLLGLVAVLALYLSSGVTARYLAETSKEQTNVKEAKVTETNPAEVGGVYVRKLGSDSRPSCALNKTRTCYPPPEKCRIYKRRCPPPSADEIIEAKPHS